MNSELRREKQTTSGVEDGDVASKCEEGNGRLPWRELAQMQAVALLKVGAPLEAKVKHVWRVRPGGGRTLHTVLVNDLAARVRAGFSPQLDFYRRPTLGEVVTGECKL